MSDTFVDDDFLAARWGTSKTTIWRSRKRPDFPQPITLTPKCVRWRLSEVEAYEAAQAEKATANRKATGKAA